MAIKEVTSTIEAFKQRLDIETVENLTNYNLIDNANRNQLLEKTNLLFNLFFYIL